MRRLLLLIIFILPTLAIHAQNQKRIDSLEKALVRTHNDTNTVIILNQLAFQVVPYDDRKAEEWINRSEKLSKQLDFERGTASANTNKGLMFRYRKKYDSSIFYLQKALVIWKKYNFERNIASVYNNMGRTYTEKGDYTNAMDYFLKARDLREKLKDTAGVAAAYNNIGNIYFNKRDFKQSKEYSRKSMLLMERKGDSFEVARNGKEIGYCYYEMNQYDTALLFFERSLRIFKAAGDKVECARLMNNIGNIYAETKRPDEGIRYHEDAMKIQAETEDSLGLFTSNLSLAQAYMFKDQYAIAEKYGDKAIAILDAAGGLPAMYADAYRIQADLLNKKGDYKKAIAAYKLFTKFNDSLIKQNNSNIVSDMLAKYESDKKDLEIKNTTYKLQQRQLIIGGLSVLIVLLIVSAYLFYNRYKLKKQRELDAELIKQQEIRNKAIIEAEERERIRIAKDLHDGIGQQLSAVKLSMSVLEGELNINAEQKARMQALRDMVDDAVKEVRTVSHNMMPNALLRQGLAAAVREFIDKIAATGALKIDLQIIGLNERLEGTMETVLYRVLQESVSNIVKHAQASKISIQLIRHDDCLNFVLEDNGKGFDTSQLNNFNGIGLKNIISRIQYLNGTVDFDSAIGKGTTVIIEVPLL